MLKSILRVFHFKQNEWVYSLLAIAIAVVATLALVFDKAERKVNPAGLKQIGKLVATGPDVKRKFFSELDFQETAKNDNVFLKDTLFVGPDSKVNLALGEYGDFELSPNSVLMVYLDFEIKPGASSALAKSTLGSSLKLKLTQGEIKYKKSTQPADPEKPIKTVTIEIADNTFLKLDGQDELKLERTIGGEITVHTATVAPVVEKLAENIHSKAHTTLHEPTVANDEPKSEYFELKVGQKITESEIKQHTNLIKTVRSPATMIEAAPVSQKVQIEKVVEEKVVEEKTIEEPVVLQPTEAVQKPIFKNWSIQPVSYEAVSLSATDLQNLKATFAANSVLGAGIGYSFNLSDASAINLNLKMKRYQFTNFSTITLTENNPTNFGFEVSYEKQISEKLRYNISAGLEEVLNLEPKSATQISLKKLISPRAGVGAIYSMGDSSNWFQGYQIKAHVDALFPAQGDNYTTKLGHKEQLKFLVVKDNKLESKNFSGGLTIYQQKFSTPFNETNQTGFGIEISIGLAGAK